MILQFLFLLCCLSSCMPMRDLPSQGEFGGIKTALDRQSAVSILIIHGLGGYATGDPDYLILTIQNKLNLQKSGDECVRAITDDYFGCKKVFGYLKQQNFCGRNEAYTLRVYTLDWGPATAQIKENFRCVDNKHADKRIPLINSMKHEIINNNLLDAALYTANYQEEIHYPIAQSIRWIQEDAKEECHHENIVIGFSLGTRIVINTLDSMQGLKEKVGTDPHSKNAAEDFIRQISSIFVLSNAGPLFELTELPAKHSFPYVDKKKCSPIACCSNVSSLDNCTVYCDHTSFGRFMYKKRSFSPDFQLVAFSDPNDPLSFILNESCFPSDCPWKNAFINEEVRNVKWSLFGFVNPVQAHIGYGHNKQVLKMIIFGLNDPCNY